MYVILQYIFDKKTLIELSKHEWDYSKWKVQITSDKKLPDWANILNCLVVDCPQSRVLASSLQPSPSRSRAACWAPWATASLVTRCVGLVHDT